MHRLPFQIVYFIVRVVLIDGKGTWLIQVNLLLEIVKNKLLQVDEDI